jgi:two-component system cell cycle response regulator
MRAADVRLYVAKRDGRNRVVHSAIIARSVADAAGERPVLVAVGPYSEAEIEVVA